MKKLFSLFFVFILFTGLSSGQSEGPETLVLSQNMVSMGDMGKVNKMLDSVFAPILNELVDEGKLFGWGQLNHAWGDEWNFNIYYIAKDHESFLAAFDEYIKRVGERHPKAWAETVKYFQAHKDNIYNFRKNYYKQQ